MTSHTQRDFPTSIALDFVDCINRGDLESLVALMSGNHRLEVFDAPPVIGRDANRAAWRAYLDAYPRYVIHPERIACCDARVAILGHTTGSHRGLPDHEEKEIHLIWLALVHEQQVETWRLIDDTPVNRAMYGLDSRE